MTFAPGLRELLQRPQYSRERRTEKHTVRLPVRRDLHPFPTRSSSDLADLAGADNHVAVIALHAHDLIEAAAARLVADVGGAGSRVFELHRRDAAHDVDAVLEERVRERPVSEVA